MESLSVILYILLMVGGALALFKKRRGMKSLPGKLPGGSRGWPVVGETLDFVSCAYSPCPESFMDKRRLMYGQVFRSHVFGSPTIVSTDAEVSKAVLQSDASAFVPWYPKPLTELMGESSILLINGSLHRRVHGLIGSFFKSPRLKAQIACDMERHLELLMANWSDGQLVYLQPEAKRIAFEILVKALIGLEPGDEMQFLKQEFQEFIAGLMSLPLKLPGSRFYRSLQARKRMLMLVKKTILEKRRRNDDKMEEKAAQAKDVIDVLQRESQLNDELISDNIIDLMIPGEESVPVLVTLAIKFLGDCPSALKRLEEENIELKRRKALLREGYQWTDYTSLSFTQDVISETLRLGNIVSGIMRKAVKDVEIKGHYIPRGWRVFLYFRSVHLDGNLYEDPYQFNPWRWKDKDMSTSCFTPFGGGQRLCPGLDLARLEASIFLHHLVTRFTWVAEEDQVVNFPTVRMKRGMPIRVHRRWQEQEQE